ncbi:MAG: cardiolipin synthase [Phycisphaerales bacterium]|nr:cardiolipin synthase [Phycisphaerales bacterium]
MLWPTVSLIAHIVLCVWLVCLLLLRQTGTGDARLAWIVFIVLTPFVGAVAYLFFGGPRIAGVRRCQHAIVHSHSVKTQIGRPEVVAHMQPEIPPPYDRVFSLANAISESDTLGGNALQLSRSPQAFVHDFVRDIDAATDTVHLLTYIYLVDDVGEHIAEALLRAAARGVAVRLQVDSAGSRAFLKSNLRRDLATGGVHVAEMLPARLFRLIFARLDLRNHRKIAVIDNEIGWVGSRNIASPAFAPKARYAPWVDCMAQLRGPAVRDLQRLFLEDWQVSVGESHTALLEAPITEAPGRASCQVIGTGPNFNNEALTQMLQACFHAARDELILTTPYYVPDAATESALRTAAMRGVKTTLIVPARNDSHLVSLASRSHYAGLIKAGVEIQEYQAGLLHAKTMTIDRTLFMLGSANLDRRSLELNFEVSLFGWCDDFASSLRFLQKSYLNDSRPVDPDIWLQQRIPGRLVRNLAGLMSPLL